MKRKIWVFCAVWVVGGPLAASGKTFRGAYVNGLLGWGQVFGKLDGETVAANQLEDAGLQKLRGRGFSSAGLALGYTGGYSNFCFGSQLELAAGLAKAGQSIGPEGGALSGSMTLNPLFSVNLPFQFGLPVNRMFFYLEGGPTWMFLKGDVRVRDAANQAIRFSKKYNTVGFLVGLGVRQQVNEHFLTALSCRYMRGYKKVKNTDLGDIKTTWSQREIIVSLGYKF